VLLDQLPVAAVEERLDGRSLGLQQGISERAASLWT
jgi:hypothetical protein